MEVKDYEEGGRNDGVIRRVGRAKFQPLVCKRDMFGPAGGDAVPSYGSGSQTSSAVRPVRHYDGTVLVQDQQRRLMAAWQFSAAVPAKLVGPQLNAKTGEIAIEEAAPRCDPAGPAGGTPADLGRVEPPLGQRRTPRHAQMV